MNQLEQTVRRICELLKPPPQMTVATFADEHVWLARGTTTEPGKYRCSRLPYQREPQESFTDPTCEEIILLWAKQMGKTQIILNGIGYFIYVDPSGILVKYPSIDGSKKFSRKKLSKFLNETPVLKDKVAPAKSRDSKNTVLEKEFPGGTISMIGANSPSSTRAQSCRVIIQDEIDSDRPNSEGDPMEQADGRAENFSDAVKIKASTPTSDGDSKIQQKFEASDQRYWHVPCPSCNHYQVLKWANVRWEFPQPDGSTKSDPENAVYVCEKCEAQWTDFDRVRAIMRGKWVASNPGSIIRGYHLSGLYRIMGKKKVFKSYLHEFVKKFLDVKDDREQLMVWTNTFLAETWRDKTEKLDWQIISARKEPYGRNKERLSAPELPKAVLVLTCAVDVQANRLEVQTDGWGLDEERWVIDTAILFGSPNKDDVWSDLDNYYARKWEHELGFNLSIDIMGIDTGGQSDNYAFSKEVYRYVRRHKQASRGQPGVMAIKGSSVLGAPLASERLQKNGVNLLQVGTDRAKATIFERLRILEPGPRYMHFHDQLEDEYFKQLTAEELKSKQRDGFTRRIWVKRRTRNEKLDLTVYGLALLDILNPNLPQIAARYAAMAEAKKKETTKPQTPAQQQAQRPARRRYLPFRQPV